MHVLTVCYGHPADPAAFDSYYASTHRPLAEKIPGLASFTARHCDSLDGSQPPYYLLAELSFASREALNAGLASPEGHAAGLGPMLKQRRRQPSPAMFARLCWMTWISGSLEGRTSSQCAAVSRSRAIASPTRPVA